MTAATTPNQISQSGVSQRLGFDKDYILSTSDMATWWASSPYFDVGIYLPGASSGPHNAPTAKHPDRVLLNDDWVSAVLGQGWGIIPIWSGPQAPCACDPNLNADPSTPFPECTTFPSKFSSDPDTAQSEGRKQADKAYDSATDLGLDGSIIYVDIEEYSHAACGSAVAGYVQGWVEEMHEYGLAGVYGNQDVAALDMTAADDGYIARGDGHVTVWGLNHYSGSGLTDKLAWTNWQRIHQYRDEAYETWGGSAKYKIDDDLVDATIVPDTGVKNYGFSVTEANQGGLAGIADGVNNGAKLLTGDVVGPSGYGESAGPFIESPTGYTFITALSGVPTQIGGINDLGDVVGFAENIGGFLYSASTGDITTITGPQGGSTMPSSVNDAGWIVGGWEGASGNGGFFLSKPPYTNPVDLTSGRWTDCLGDSGTGANGINGLGQAVYTVASGGSGGPPPILVAPVRAAANANVASPTGAVYVCMTDLQSATPESTGSASILAETDASDGDLLVAGINNNGQVAGTSSSGPSAWEICFAAPGQGFLINTDDSLLTFSLPDPMWSCLAGGINDDVQMVGTTDVGGTGQLEGFMVDTPH